jgi:hypothetical protein
MKKTVGIGGAEIAVAQSKAKTIVAAAARVSGGASTRTKANASATADVSASGVDLKPPPSPRKRSSPIGNRRHRPTMAGADAAAGGNNPIIRSPRKTGPRGSAANGRIRIAALALAHLPKSSAVQATDNLLRIGADAATRT